MAFRRFLGDIGNEVPLYLRGAPNRTSMVECEGPESQGDIGTERESWPGSAMLPNLTRTLRSYPVRTSMCSSVPPYSFLSRQVLGPRHQHSKGHQPTWVRARFCMSPLPRGTRCSVASPCNLSTSANPMNVEFSNKINSLVWSVFCNFC